MEDKQKLINLVKQSPLPVEDQALWEESVGRFPAESVESFLGIFSQFPQEIPWFTANLKRKREAFERMKADPQEGQRLWDAIFEEEKSKLAQLLSL